MEYYSQYIRTYQHEDRHRSAKVKPALYNFLDRDFSIPKIEQHLADVFNNLSDITDFFNNYAVTYKDVRKARYKLRNNSLTCSDTVPVGLLNLVADKTSAWQTHIITESIKRSIFPEKLKTFRISPIWKSWSKWIRWLHTNTDFIGIIRSLWALNLILDDRIYEKKHLLEGT